MQITIYQSVICKLKWKLLQVGISSKMNNDPGIICFHHCSIKNVFCWHVPTICPVCSSQMQDLLIYPFRVPYPFTNARPITIVIKPSQGSFLNDYNVTCNDLHIGIVDSNGNVWEFDKNGLSINNMTKWTDCIVLEVISAAWTARWDETLSFMSKDFKWKFNNYNASNMNCFNFVLEFFNNLEYVDLSFTSKEELCKQLILPKMQNAIRYISLYRALKDQEYLLSDHYI